MAGCSLFFVMKESYQTLLEEIRRDNVSGASVIAQRAAKCLSAFVEDIRGIKVDTARRLLTELGEQLRSAQPRMAPLWNLINEAYLIAETRSDPSAMVKELETLAKGYAARCEAAEKRLVMHAMSMLDCAASIVTYSSSRTVLRILQQAHRSGCLRTVYLTESRPAHEGRALAMSLLDEGITCVFGVDAMLGLFTRAADAALVGADAITAESLSNKIGTRAFALLCREAGVRLYAVADHTKLLPPGATLAPEPQHDPDEVWDGRPKGLHVDNRYFEETPLAEFRAIITDEGVFEPSEIRHRAAEIQISERLSPKRNPMI